MALCIRHLVVIVTLIFLAACTAFPQTGASTVVSTTDPALTGLQVVPVEVPSDDLTRILGMSRWKFHLFLPHSDRNRDAENSDDELIHLRYKLEIRHAGHPSITLGSFIISDHSPDAEQEVDVALYPVDQPGGEPERMNVYLNGFRLIIDNPQKKDEGAVLAIPARLLSDGSFLLMEMDKATRGEEPPPTTRDTRQLVFSLTRLDRP